MVKGMDANAVAMLMELDIQKKKENINKYKNGAIYQAKSMGWIGDDYPYLEELEKNNTDSDTSDSNTIDSNDDEIDNTDITDNTDNTDTVTYNNDNETENIPAKEEVSIADLDTETLSYDEFVIKVKQRGLKVVEEQIDEEIPYYLTTKDKYYEAPTDGVYYKGDTVTIYVSKIVPVTKRFESDFISCGYSVILSESTFLDESKTKKGVKVYFNDNLVMSGDGEFNYKFTNERQVKIKVVAPYIKIDGEWKTNYTIFETTDSIENLFYYADNRMGLASAYRSLINV